MIKTFDIVYWCDTEQESALLRDSFSGKSEMDIDGVAYKICYIKKGHKNKMPVVFVGCVDKAWEQKELKKVSW